MHFVPLTRVSCDDVAGCAGALLVAGDQGEVQLLAAPHVRHVAHGVVGGVALVPQLLSQAVGGHHHVELCAGRRLPHHPGRL